jgi:tripartite-type tricarboxylate transporter receptor subunit TctC
MGGSYRSVGPVAATWGGTVGMQNPPTVTGGTAGPQTVTGTNTYLTTPIEITPYQSCSFQPVWTGTPTGVITLQGSNDGVNFDDIAASVPTQPAGSASHTLITVFGLPVKWIQLKYVNASGSGTLVANFMGRPR